MAKRSPGFVSAAQNGATAFGTLRRAAETAVSRRASGALLFTGTHPGDGTSTVAGNYAAMSSAAGISTLLIDASLLRPALHARLHVEPRPGLIDVVAGVAVLDDAIVTTTLGGSELSFLPAGGVVRGATGSLGSQAGVDLISDVCGLFEAVVIDSPPVLAVSDAAVLAAHSEVDTIVVVAHRQRRKRLTKTVTELRRAGGNVIGLAVNTG